MWTWGVNRLLSSQPTGCVHSQEDKWFSNGCATHNRTSPQRPAMWYIIKRGAWQDTVPLVSDGHSRKAHLGAREMRPRFNLVRPLRVVEVELLVHQCLWGQKSTPLLAMEHKLSMVPHPWKCQRGIGQGQGPITKWAAREGDVSAKRSLKWNTFLLN